MTSALARALEGLYARAPFGMRFGLEATREACARWEHPERAFPTVHVAGTNGKGSVCAMVESIARSHGLKTGLYTSPHLCRFAERIQVAGAPIEDDMLAGWLARVLDADPELSFFEVATLTAFLAFREAHVDLAVVEVGLGGRLDATNVLPTPRVAAITRIALDHTELLGPTLIDIAREKAGIAKPGLPIVLGSMPADVRAAVDEVARAHGATTSTLEDVPAPANVGLAGEHQKENARIAAALGARIGASPEVVQAGIARARWPGRLERIGRCLLDAAHNPDGAAALARHVRSLGLSAREVVLVFGTLADKDWATMLDLLAPLAATRFYVAPQAGVRAGALADAMAARHPGTVTHSTSEAISRALNPALVVVAGSIVLVGEARAFLLRLPRDPPVTL